MKRNALFISTITAFALSTTYADSSNELQHIGTFSLDRSHNIFFEQLSTSNFPLSLLQIKNQFPTGELVAGGMAEGDWQHWQGDKLLTITPTSTYKQGTAFYFTQATFDLMGTINNWSTLFLSIADTAIGQSSQNGNYIYSPHAFFLVGDLNQFPFYFTGGINSITFGQFNGSGTWDKPLTANYFYPQPSPELSLAFHKNNWDLSTTIYKDQVLYQNHSVYALNYINTISSFTYGFGLGYLTHLNLNSTGAPNLNRSYIAKLTDLNAGDISDINATFGYKQVTLTGEYAAGSKAVRLNSNTPHALGLALNYTPIIFNTNYTFGLSYSNTQHLKDIPTTLSGKDAIPLVASGLHYSWAASASRTLFRDWFLVGLDAERDVTYENKKTYTYTLDMIAYL